jgi:hypothetical protein
MIKSSRQEYYILRRGKQELNYIYIEYSKCGVVLQRSAGASSIVQLASWSMSRSVNAYSRG